MDELSILDEISDYLNIDYVTLDGESVDIDSSTIEIFFSLQAGESTEIIISTTVIDPSLTETVEISNQVIFYTDIKIDETEVITYYLEATVNGDDGNSDDNSDEEENLNYENTDDGSSDTDDSDTNTNNSDSSSDDNSNSSSTSSAYAISGTVWNDSDKDGQRDSSENGISGITVRVIDVSSGEAIDTSTSTGSDGTYSLSLEEGTYIIVFLYDSSTYSITTYQASGVSDDANSDAIKDSIEIDGATQTVASTDNISLTSDTTNIDLGLIESSEANLSIAKYVTQIIVENSTGTKTYTQDDEETLAKVEIGSKVISGSNVTVEYVIEITNSGEQSGDIGTIVDYLPSELSFSTSSNSGWYESGDYIYNDSLENEEIDPGETKEVTLILTKTMTDSNTGLINNKTGLLSSDGETEISTASADIMIGIKTGTIITYISLIIVILLIILIAIYVINEKHILEKMFSR